MKNRVELFSLKKKKKRSDKSKHTKNLMEWFVFIKIHNFEKKLLSSNT